MKKFMRKALVVGVIAAMAVSMLALSACGKKSGGDAKTDWDYIEDKGELIVGLDDTFAPMGFRDKEDNLVGLDIELAEAVGEKLGVKIKFQPIDWDAKEAELKAKNIDCIWNGMSATPERQESMSLSKKYLNNKVAVMTLDKNKNFKSTDDFKKVKIGTQADSAALEAIKADEHYEEFKDNVVEYKTYDQAILDVKAGRTEAVVIDEVFAYYNNKEKDTKMYESDFNFGDDFYAIGFRKEDTGLTEKVNEALKEVIDDGTAEEISKKWFDKNLIIYED